VFINDYGSLQPGQLSRTKQLQRDGRAALLALDTLQPELGNLALFGLEGEDGDDIVNWHWRSVGELISECNDPARPPIRGCNKKFLHWRLRRFVENIYFRLLTFLLIVLDIGLVVAEILSECSWRPVSISIRRVDLVLSVYFIIEVGLRLVAITPKVFFSWRKSWHNVVDLVVVLLATAASIASNVILDCIGRELDASLFQEESGKWEKVDPNLCHIKVDITEYERQVEGYWCENNSGLFSQGGAGTTLSLLSILRIIRVFRFVRLFRIYFEHRNVLAGVRQKICENKRRFQVDGYDLDLTYILTNVIAMSFPSRGTQALYRNKIDNVAKFFEEKYSDRENIDYMLYNLCSEMEYDHRKFHGNVRRYRIDDHNVPTLEQMFQLVDDVRNWLSGGEGRERVVAVHCKGGKGRTGTMICAILIDKGVFKDASDYLQYFGQRRTDLNVSKQFQGVETYSQIRYVHYFQSLYRDKIRDLPSRPLLVTGVNITGLRHVGAGDGSDFSLAVYSGGAEVWRAGFSAVEHCRLTGAPELDRVEISFSRPATVDRDTKFMFHCSTKGVPKGYDDCAFFCWLHTHFIHGGRELLPRHQLDNPHKAEFSYCSGPAGATLYHL